MNHSPGFLKIVDDSKARVHEISVQQCLDDIQKNPAIALIDVREESEYAAGHARGAEHIGRGVIERDIEHKHPDHGQILYLYCGGGFRSALAADNLQKMGYTRVYSVAGGWRAFLDIKAPTEKP